MSLEDKKLFLAGSTGMAGTSILRHLLDNYPKIKIRASYHNAAPFIQDSRIEYVQGDLTCVGAGRDMCQGCDCAIMAASQAGGANFVRSQPWEHMKQNLLMNVQMLEAFRLEKIERIIFIGSAVIYHEFEGSIKEEDFDPSKEPVTSSFAFGWAMRFLEKMCFFINQNYGIDVAVVRLANIYGPYDKFNPEVSNFIPAIIRKAVDKMDPFEVWGTPDVTRDVLFADDFARAIALLADSRLKFEIFNLGSGVRTTVGDVVKWALHHASHAPKRVEYLQNRPTTAKFRALDCSKAKQLLGWQPNFSVEEGIKKTVDWWTGNRTQWRR